MQTGGAAPKSTVYHKINTVASFGLENNNGTIRTLLYTGAGVNSLIYSAGSFAFQENTVIAGYNADSATLKVQMRGTGTSLVDVLTFTGGVNGGASPSIVTASAATLGFYGATAVAKQVGCAVPTDLTTCIAAITALRTALNNLGLTTVV
jgi:hypothetical protein